MSNILDMSKILANRRTVLAMAATAGAIPALSGCVGSGEVGYVPLPDTDIPLPDTLAPEAVGFVPQFFQAEQGGEWREFTEIGFSLHCGGTRDWFRANGFKLADDIAQGRTVAFFSHLVRSENEIPVGVEMMRVGQARYPEAVVACIGLSMRLDRPLGAAELREFLASLDMPPAPELQYADAELRLLAVAKAYYEGLGIRETPFIRQSPFSEAGGAA